MNPLELVKDYRSFLGEVRKCPGLWLGTTSLTALEHQLMGFKFAEELHEISQANRLSGFDWEAFESWVDEKHNRRHLSLKSFGLAKRIARSETKAFHLWFEWMDEFEQAQSQ